MASAIAQATTIRLRMKYPRTLTRCGKLSGELWRCEDSRAQFHTSPKIAANLPSEFLCRGRVMTRTLNLNTVRVAWNFNLCGEQYLTELN
ncbi:MAG TPA: hypothetical protein VGM05_23290 [Planctomycetaceae bacterium]|jgi:hypothetical protein